MRHEVIGSPNGVTGQLDTNCLRQENSRYMNSSSSRPEKGASVLVWAMFFLKLAVLPSVGQDVQHLSITQPGGMPGLPVLTGIQTATNGVTLNWDGPSGYYQVFEQSKLAASTWTAAGKATNLARRVTVSPVHGNTFFRVSGPSPQYAGSATCSACHENIYATQTNTPHAHAFGLLSVQQQTNAALLPGLTVGYGLPTGFKSLTATPQLADVQCENCHGPAGNHAASEMDPTVRPRVELAATVCGGCHTGLEFPIYPEWSSSAHAAIVAGPNFNSTNLIDNCGRCHSGSVRYALFEGLPLPYGDADLGIVCATCHDPHQTNANPAQLRFPVASTNDYFITPSGVFTNQVNAAINLCAQCHNHRGASWTNSTMPPHHSPQYNIMLGTVGEFASGQPSYQPGAHALLITNQCVGCHMQTSPYQGGAQPAMAGHTFTVDSYNLCLNCHEEPAALVQFAQGVVTNQIQQLVQQLDQWAATQAPAGLYAKYNVRAWEYSTPGGLSPSGPGPDATEQALIPVNIQKARFNLYLVFYDGSLGAHNSPYIGSLLFQAGQWVQAELGD